MTDSFVYLLRVDLEVPPNGGVVTACAGAGWRCPYRHPYYEW